MVSVRIFFFFYWEPINGKFSVFRKKKMKLTFFFKILNSVSFFKRYFLVMWQFLGWPDILDRDRKAFNFRSFYLDPNLIWPPTPRFDPLGPSRKKPKFGSMENDLMALGHNPQFNTNLSLSTLILKLSA